LRKFYPEGTDEPHFDLTAATEKALAWLEGLTERAFVGTESRLITLFELLRQMSTGSQTDPEVRIAELQKRRDDIDAEIVRIRAGEISLLDDTGLKDRFQQFLQLARELLTDFREVEHNFRILDRRVRERIALWEGSKGELLEEIMGERDAIADSDQGKSFRAFWDFSQVAVPPGEVEPASGRGAGFAADCDHAPRQPSAARSLRLAGGRRAYPADGGPAFRAIAQVSR